MRNQATKFDVIARQKERRCRRIQFLVCFPMAILIAGLYAALALGLIAG